MIQLDAGQGAGQAGTMKTALAVVISGAGNMIVKFLSAPISTIVWRLRSWSAKCGALSAANIPSHCCYWI